MWERYGRLGIDSAIPTLRPPSSGSVPQGLASVRPHALGPLACDDRVLRLHVHAATIATKARSVLVLFFCKTGF